MFENTTEIVLTLVFAVASLGSLWAFARRQGTAAVLTTLSAVVGCSFLYTFEGQALWVFKVLVILTLANLLTTVTYLAYLSAGTAPEWERVSEDLK